MSTFPTKILLASDSSDTAAHAMDLAVELCEQTGSQLHLVYVGEDAYSATLISPEALLESTWLPYRPLDCPPSSSLCWPRRGLRVAEPDEPPDRDSHSKRTSS